ncbi:MAG: tRNA uridine-5-carboxymethylaminomethyl(34) synthesis GTPase MnmE [Gammaproteobacteria bacterium]
MPATNDLIAAIATPPGIGGIGIIRISGGGMQSFAAALLKSQLPPPRMASRARFVDDGGGLIDDGLVLYFPAPFSFTGEDVLELHGHGGAAACGLLLARCLQLGARMAEAGEFSLRAYLNGKMDLSQAEALCDLINANSAASARAAAASMTGALSEKTNAIAKKMTRLRAQMEAQMDFADDDTGAPAKPDDALDEIAAMLDDLLHNAKRGAKMRDGLCAVITGKPNVGKSSLLNCLTGENAAIVAAKPGTTRDIIRRDIHLDGMTLCLADTAGLRDSADVVEAEGIARAKAEMQNADIIIAVSDAQNPPPKTTTSASAATSTIIVVNKTDISGERPGKKGGIIYVSAKTGEGINTLREELQKIGGMTNWQPPFSARTRHLQALTESRKHLADAKNNRAHLELCCASLSLAQQAAATISGSTDDEDILAEIFSTFCIGK